VIQINDHFLVEISSF